MHSLPLVSELYFCSSSFRSPYLISHSTPSEESVGVSEAEKSFHQQANKNGDLLGSRIIFGPF